MRSHQPRKPLPFATERNTLLEHRQGKDWLPGYVTWQNASHVGLRAPAPARDRWTVPKSERRLRIPRPERALEIRLAAELARHEAAMLPKLSGTVLVSAKRNGRADPKRRKRYDSSAYERYVGEHPCIVSGDPDATPCQPIEKHHDPHGADRGVAQRVDVYDLIPLRPDLHRHFTDTGCFPGLDKTQTEIVALRAKNALLKGWIARHEQKEGEGEDGAARLSLCMKGMPRTAPAILPKLAAAAVVLLIFLLSSLPACAAPDDPAWREINKGRVELRMARPGRAAYHARQALRQRHYPAAAYVLLGDALRAQNRCIDARPEYLKAWEALPGDPDALKGFCSCGGDQIGQVVCPGPSSVAQAGGSR